MFLVGGAEAPEQAPGTAWPGAAAALPASRHPATTRLVAVAAAAAAGGTFQAAAARHPATTRPAAVAAAVGTFQAAAVSVAAGTFQAAAGTLQAAVGTVGAAAARRARASGQRYGLTWTFRHSVGMQGGLQFRVQGSGFRENVPAGW